MRNTLLKKYFSYIIILINNKLSKNNENMRNAFLPPAGKEGWLKAGVVGGYTMLIITDLRIHLPPPPTGTPPSRRRRMENTIGYQIIVEYYRLSNYYFPN